MPETSSSRQKVAISNLVPLQNVCIGMIFWWSWKTILVVNQAWTQNFPNHCKSMSWVLQTHKIHFVKLKLAILVLTENLLFGLDFCPWLLNNSSSICTNVSNGSWKLKNLLCQEGGKCWDSFSFWFSFQSLGCSLGWIFAKLFPFWFQSSPHHLSEMAPCTEVQQPDQETGRNYVDCSPISKGP